MSYFIKSFFALQKSSIVLTLKGSIDIIYTKICQFTLQKSTTCTPVVTLIGSRIWIKHLLFTYYYRTLLLVNVFFTPAIRYNLIMIRLITVDIENTQYNPHSLKAKKQAAGYHYQNTREIEYSSLPCHHNPAITTEFIPPREHFPLPNHLFRHFLCGTRVRIFRHPVRGYRDIGTLFHWQGSCIHFPRWTFVRNLVIAKSVLLQIQIQINC